MTVSSLPALVVLNANMPFGSFYPFQGFTFCRFISILGLLDVLFND